MLNINLPQLKVRERDRVGETFKVDQSLGLSEIFNLISKWAAICWVNHTKAHSCTDPLHRKHLIVFSGTGTLPLFLCKLRGTLPKQVCFNGWKYNLSQITGLQVKQITKCITVCNQCRHLSWRNRLTSVFSSVSNNCQHWLCSVSETETTGKIQSLLSLDPWYFELFCGGALNCCHIGFHQQ